MPVLPPAARRLCRLALARQGCGSSVPGAGLLVEWGSRQLGRIPDFSFLKTDSEREAACPGSWHSGPGAALAWGSHRLLEYKKGVSHCS